MTKAVWVAASIFLVTALSCNRSAGLEPSSTTRNLGKTFDQSELSWPADPHPGDDSPNVLVWVVDDLGFGQLGSYGGLVETPNLDRVANAGLRYTNFHVTPVCSASRAALLTGRNSHAVHVGSHAGAAVGFPGYDAHIPRSAGTIAENLRQAGYITYALGKWDHLPSAHVSANGPFTYWPSGQGFDRFYGFLGADADNFRPVLWADHHPVELPADRDYHLTSDLADRAIEWIESRSATSPRRPFFMYWATGAVHAPHHAPEEYLRHYRGRFDQGWDAAREEILRRQKSMGLVPQDTTLPPRPEGMKAWSSLSADEKRSYARAMEVFAAQLTHADAEFGRILSSLEALGELDQTLILVVSDNGASAEGALNGSHNEFVFANGFSSSVEENLRYYDKWGGPETYPHYPMGWGFAGNTPFRYYKITTYEGGVRVPLIASWPKGIPKQGGVRAQFHHVADIAPTILDALQLQPADTVNGVEQTPFEGTSFKYTFADADAKSRKGVQYFEMFGARAIWADGWKAVAPNRLRTWDLVEAKPITDEGWELYDLTSDFNELRNLADSEPKRLRSMIELFDSEARRYNVYPLLNISDTLKVRNAREQEVWALRNGVWIYKGPAAQLHETQAPPLLSRAFTVTARLNVPANASGAVMAMGGFHGGMSLYFVNGRPVFAYRNLDRRLSRFSADAAVSGPTCLRVEFAREGKGARINMTVDEKVLASGEIPGPLPGVLFSLNETFDIGSDSGTGPSGEYEGSFPFSGSIEELRFDVAPTNANSASAPASCEG